MSTYCCCDISFCKSKRETVRLWNECEGLQKECEGLRKESEGLKSSYKFQTEELQSTLNFLRLQLHNDKADGIMKGDVAFLCQAPYDCVKPQLLYAHKFILASKSPVFSKMFEVNMRESETGLVRIDDATLGVMQAVIGFCYTAEIKFIASEAESNYDVPCEEVLEVAHKYGIDPLVRKCEERLIKTINNDNLPTLLKLARKLGTKLLHAAALQYLKTHFEDVIAPVLDHLC